MYECYRFIICNSNYEFKTISKYLSILIRRLNIISNIEVPNKLRVLSHLL